MIRLARVFTDGLVLQRGMPALLWGESDAEQSVSVRLDGAEILRADIPQGAFSLSLPPQQARENATLAVGDTVLHNVDIGEVWLAGGQSNMEFYLEYTQGGEEEIAAANDAHLRMYTVGQRLALLARKYVYGEKALLADAPKAVAAARVPEGIRIEFAAGDGLTLCQKDNTSYNGFAAGEIPPELLPPVLGGVNGLRVLADGAALESAECAVDGARLIIRAPELAAAKQIRVEFAETAFYRVNLVNRAGIPAMPFTLENL